MESGGRKRRETPAFAVVFTSLTLKEAHLSDRDVALVRESLPFLNCFCALEGVFLSRFKGIIFETTGKKESSPSSLFKMSILTQFNFIRPLPGVNLLRKV